MKRLLLVLLVAASSSSCGTLGFDWIAWRVYAEEGEIDGPRADFPERRYGVGLELGRDRSGRFDPSPVYLARLEALDRLPRGGPESPSPGPEPETLPPEPEEAPGEDATPEQPEDPQDEGAADDGLWIDTPWGRITASATLASAVLALLALWQRERLAALIRRARGRDEEGASS